MHKKKQKKNTVYTVFSFNYISIGCGTSNVVIHVKIRLRLDNLSFLKMGGPK